jgi:hypothetical protein
MSLVTCMLAMPACCLACLQDSAELDSPPPLLDVPDADSSRCCQDGAASKRSKLSSSSSQTAEMVAAIAVFEVGG